MAGRDDRVIGTSGHIDHGKTALVRALTGVDTDRLPAEKRRGITIDLGFAALDLGDRRVSLVDVPGHERFIRNMLAGASGLDLALLVIAADDSVMPQTREHLEILRLLGLPGGVVALTKCDLAEPGWLAMVEEEARALVAGTFLEGAEIVRTSATTGMGIEGLRDALRRVCDATPARDDPGPFRMAIDRSFTVSGHGTVVTGTVASGSIGVGDEVEWLPGGGSARVRGLHRHDRPVDRVARGARAAINLVGVHHSEIGRGHELAEPGYLVPSRVLSVEIRGSDGAARALRHRGRYRLHLGTAEVAATLSLLEPAKEGPALAQLLLGEAVAAVHGQPFVIREESPPATLGGGRVLLPWGRRVRRRDGVGIERLARLGSPDPSERLAAALASHGLASWTDRAISRDTGLAVEEVRLRVGALVKSGAMASIPAGPRRSVLVPRDLAEILEDRALRAIARLHEASPRLAAIARPRVASALADLGNDALVGSLIDRLKAGGKVVADARTVAIAGHEPKLTQAERKLKREIAEAYQSGRFTPPDPSDWAGRAGPKSAGVAELLGLLRDEERLVEIGPGLYLDHDAEAEIRRRVADRLGDGSAMTMAELRDWLGTTRKHAVPIGEHLDRIGVTVRSGDSRTLAKHPGESPP